MEKKALPSNHSPKQEEYPPSDIHSADQCITFISLSHYQMHKLVHDTQSFVNKIKSINRMATKQIELGAFKEALSLLIQGQKILEYAAGSGKPIERDLIICTLHNIAAAYHKLWILDKCQRYVEGLIFNLQNHLHSLQNSVVSSNQQQQFIAACNNLDIQKMLAVYNLRYCALVSQEENHKEALTSAKKAIGYVKGILTFDEQYIKTLLRKEQQSEANVQLKHRLLLQVLEYESTMNLRKQKDILKAAHFSIQIWNRQKEKNTSSRYKFLKTYSIGDFMEFKAIQYHSKNEPISLEQQNIRHFEESIVFKLLLLSISFFSTAAEIRLNLADNHNQYYSQLQRQNGSQFIQSQLYHLLSIIVITAFLPFEILYVSHALNSYSNYFNSGLLDYKTVQKESYEKIIELISDNKYKSPYIGSTEIISSDELLPEHELNEYKLADRFKDNGKHSKKHPNRQKKIGEKNESKKNSRSKNFSSLESKSIINQDKKSKPSMKVDSKLKDKTKSKHKSKSKTLQKKSKERDKYMYLKVTNSKPKKKHVQDEVGTLSKKVSPKKSKDHAGARQFTGSQITKQMKKSILNHRVPSTKKILAEHRSPKRRNNIYGLKY